MVQELDTSIEIDCHNGLVKVIQNLREPLVALAEFPFQLAEAQRPRDRGVELRLAERFNEETVRRGAFRTANRLGIPVRSRKDDRDTQPRADPLCCLDAVDGSGEGNIHQNEIGMKVLCFTNRRLSITHNTGDLVPHLLDHFLEIGCNNSLILNDQQTCSAHTLSFSSSHTRHLTGTGGTIRSGSDSASPIPRRGRICLILSTLEESIRIGRA